ncbi:anti-sigma factor family protein [Cellvibrio fontiphilus]|uniref:Anti-sigma factor family protein n=1 Tax=Cellvibrio fontiphilus TaxID=1815559 RepID=A0ABV7FDM6_9GAMM
MSVLNQPSPQQVSDEQLSAFLDAELPAAEMEAMREQISRDENLANRLAELAMVDTRVASHYRRIDEQPMPEAITRLLSDEPQVSDEQPTNNVITFPLWRRMQRSLQQHAAMAASVALVIGFGAAQLLPGNTGSSDNWNAIAQALDTTRSGEQRALADGSELIPRLSFIDQVGDYCRQFHLSSRTSSAENIACRRDNQWQLTLSVHSQARPAADDYQTASGSDHILIENALDNMMQGDAFDAAAEAAAIKNHWRSAP